MKKNQNQITTSNSNANSSSETSTISGAGGSFSSAEINARLNIQENLLLNCLDQIQQLVAGQVRMENAIQALSKGETNVSGIQEAGNSTSRDA